MAWCIFILLFNKKVEKVKECSKLLFFFIRQRCLLKLRQPCFWCCGLDVDLIVSVPDFSYIYLGHVVFWNWADLGWVVLCKLFNGQSCPELNTLQYNKWKQYNTEESGQVRMHFVPWANSNGTDQAKQCTIRSGLSPHDPVLLQIFSNTLDQRSPCSPVFGI